ncbi:MAG: hypothetical protein OXK81_08585 [Chloroflexota bacterium]|nr:hypothetical protein [Chloroflexota bacterium]
MRTEIEHERGLILFGVMGHAVRFAGPWQVFIPHQGPVIRQHADCRAFIVDAAHGEVQHRHVTAVTVEKHDVPKAVVGKTEANLRYIVDDCVHIDGTE